MEAAILISSVPFNTSVLAQPQHSLISTLPNDVLRLILEPLSLTDKIRCALTCRRWRSILRTHYHKAQFMARFNVLKCFISSFGLQSGNELERRASQFLESTEVDKFSKLELPCTASSLQRTVNKILGLHKPTGDQLLIEIQHFLEREAKSRQISAFYWNHTRFNLDTNDPLEFQAYRDCLLPIMKPIFSGQPIDLWGVLLNEHCPLMINLYSEAAFRYSGDRHQKIRYDMESILTPDHLSVFFLYILPLAKNLRKLEFSSTLKTISGYNWNKGKALKTIQQGLIDAPVLEELCFSKLNISLDETNAIALAEIIKLRQLKRPNFRFKVISFGPESISRTGLTAFIQALKNYPEALTIYVSELGNIGDIFDPSTIPLFLVNHRLHLRFHPGEQLKKIIYLYHPARQYILSCHISNAEKIEALRR